MAVALIKIVNGNPAMNSAIPNQQKVKCPYCGRTYGLAIQMTNGTSSARGWEKLNERCGRATRQNTQLMCWNCGGNVPSAPGLDFW